MEGRPCVHDPMGQRELCPVCFPSAPPKKNVVEKTPPKQAPFEKIEAGLKDAIDWSQCPRCRERAEKKAASMRRYREKKK